MAERIGIATKSDSRWQKSLERGLRSARLWKHGRALTATMSRAQAGTPALS
jgi:hypothetical protein